MKKLFAAVSALMLSLCLLLSAGAVEQPIDFNKSGSLTVTLRCPDGTNSGGTVMLYSVATLDWDGSDYVFLFTEAFADVKIDTDDLESKENAKSLYDHISQNGITGTERTLENGSAVYDDLPVGLYLLVQTETAEGFSTASPFFLTVPVLENDEWVYDVDASPKVEVSRVEIPSPPDIPQTGQLKWPIPVLAMLGLVIFAFGWAVYFKGSDKQ